MLAFVSDVHIRRTGDENSKLFLKFLQHPVTQKAEKIFLLGDIFDLMVGEKNEYLKAFSTEFSEIKKLAESGKEIIFVEGNHDFHLKKLLEKYFKGNKFRHYDRPFIEEYDGTKILVCHGDEIELENPSYQKYRSFIKSGLIKFLANNVAPYIFIKSVGENASQTSRKYSANYENDLVREKFKRSAKQACDQYGVQKTIFGHSHLLEIIQSDSFTYINNGFFPKTQKFSVFEDGKFRFEEI